MARKEKKQEKQELQQARPVGELSPFSDIDRLFDSFFRHGWLRPRLEWPSWTAGETPFGGKLPNVDVVDRDTEVVVRAELPGVDKKDLDVTVTGNSVSIRGSTRHEEKEEKGDYYRCEISRGAFARVVPLPADVDPDQAKSSFDNGVLELTLPKVKSAKRRTIKVE